MKNIKIMFVFVALLAFSNSQAQDTQKSSNSEIHYKVIFPDIDQFQLKEMVPICSELFQAPAGSKGGPVQALYFETTVEVTAEMLKAKLLENNYTFKFNLIVLNDKNTTDEEE